MAMLVPIADGACWQWDGRKSSSVADDGGTRWPKITSQQQRLKLEGFCCKHGEDVIDGSGFLVHDQSWLEKGREKMLGLWKNIKREPKEGWTSLLWLWQAFCYHSPRIRQRQSGSSEVCLSWGCQRRRRGRQDRGKRGGKGVYYGWWHGRRPSGSKNMQGDLDRGREGVREWEMREEMER